MGLSVTIDAGTGAGESAVLLDDFVGAASLTVDDGNGATDSDTATVQVRNADPVIVSGGDVASEALALQPVSISPVSITDAGVQDTHAGTIDYGDGSAIVAGVVAQGAGSAVIAFAAHTYAAPGAYNVTVTVTDDDGGQTQLVRQITILGPQDLKARAIQALTPYDDNKHVRKAIKAIEKSLKPRLWVDDMHLDPKRGHKVFNRERYAVKKLMDLLKHDRDDDDDDDKGKRKHDISDEARPVIEGAIEDLVAADRMLAQEAILDAQQAPTLDPDRQNKVDRALARATAELDRGDAELADGDPDDAIKHYRKAWKHAIKALKEKAHLPDNDDGEDDDDD